MMADKRVIGLILMLAVGCSQSADRAAAPGEDRPGTANQAGTPGAVGPEQAVTQFLTAVQTGDDEAAAQMLTPVARQKTAEHDLVVAPPGSDTASFRVGEYEMIGDEGAHVASFWTDKDEEGKDHTDTIVWMVRKLPEGWKIAGMALRVFEDEPAVIMNFEDPEDMLAKQQSIEAQMAGKVDTGEEIGVEPTIRAAQTEQPEGELRPNRLRQR
jgi:hypothetical protein